MYCKYTIKKKRLISSETRRLTVLENTDAGESVVYGASRCEMLTSSDDGSQGQTLPAACDEQIPD